MTEHERWSRNFAGTEFFYGHDPGPVARRAVRYHRPLLRPRQRARAIDVGCGEGQDTLFLAQCGYDTTGVDFTASGLDKAQRLLHEKGQSAHLVRADMINWTITEQFDLVLAVNSLQFTGADAPRVLRQAQSLVAPGGVIGLSMFAREEADTPPLEGTIYRWTLDELLAGFEGWQPFEAARLWQWSNNDVQPFVTLIAQKGEENPE